MLRKAQLLLLAGLTGCSSAPLIGTANAVIVRPELLSRIATSPHGADWVLSLRDGSASNPHRGKVLARGQIGTDGSLRFALPSQLPVMQAGSDRNGQCLWITSPRAVLAVRPQARDATGFRNPLWEQMITADLRSRMSQRQLDEATALQQGVERQADEALVALRALGFEEGKACRLGSVVSNVPRPPLAVDANRHGDIAAGQCAEGWTQALGEPAAALLHRMAGRGAGWEARSRRPVDAPATPPVLSGPDASLLFALAQASYQFLQRDEAMRTFERLDDDCQARARAHLQISLSTWRQALVDAQDLPQLHLTRCKAAGELLRRQRLILQAAKVRTERVRQDHLLNIASRPAPDAPGEDLRPFSCS